MFDEKIHLLVKYLSETIDIPRTEERGGRKRQRESFFSSPLRFITAFAQQMLQAPRSGNGAQGKARAEEGV